MNQQNHCSQPLRIPNWVLPLLIVAGAVSVIFPILVWFVGPIVFCLGGAFFASAIFRTFEGFFEQNLSLRQRFDWILCPLRKLFSLPFWVLGVGLASLFLAVGFWWNR